MKFLDAYILARTKRKTRRIRTSLVVIVSSLLFAVLFGGAFIAQGVFNAADQVKDVGFNSRNMVSIFPTGGGSFDFVAMQQAIENQMNDELKARDIVVSEETKQDPRYQLEFSRRFGKAAAEAQESAQQKLEEEVHRLSDPSAVYHLKTLPLSQYARHQSNPAADPLVEELRQQEETGVNAEGFKGPGQVGGRLEFYSVEQGMMRTQLYPGQTFDWQPGQAYPMIISYSYLEKLADRSLANLSAAERNAGYRELMAEYAGKELTHCYRNSTAQSQLQDVIHYNYLIKNDEDATEKPIDVPVCGGFDQELLKDRDIISDEDTEDEEPLFPLPDAPPLATQQIKFKIVGFTPASTQMPSSDIVTRVLTEVNLLPTSPSPGIIPSEVTAKEPLLTSGGGGDFIYNFTNLFADFKTRDEQKAFIAEGCTGNECNEGKKPFIIAFGSLSLTLEGVFRTAAKVLLAATGVIVVIAALMIMFTISKVISDSTKEIAVFRSLGARRRDIAQIYYTYGTMLALSALVLAVVLALIGALVVSHLYANSVAQGLVQSTGAYTTEVHVNLVGLNWLWLIGIAAALGIAAFLGIVVPVLAAVRRKLAAILREE